MGLFLRRIALVAAVALPSLFCAAQNWSNVGPDGGDARSFASDTAQPGHLFLGTTASWIYESMDDGDHWHLLSKVADTDSLVVDHIVVDESQPSHLLAGAWVMDRPDGGIFVSEDAGRHWRSVEDMQGQSVRALAQAPSDPKVFVAGTLRGVYESRDGGEHWALISPAGSTEIHEVESIAIDPAHPAILYAGTWHLPWKTEDGGITWRNIHRGVIDDSDVFSIILDPKRPETVYASACSGIYKSLNGGTIFRKVQGIPATARRTRVLMQDPTNRDVVYAGTTQGLYKTTDAGTVWERMTPDDIIINDIHISPKNPQHVLLATDRGGVLVSDDGMKTFHTSNRGFSQMQVAALAVDAQHPSSLYAGTLNGKRFGGVFFSLDNGATWVQHSDGLDGRDVYSLMNLDTGRLLAGTSHGVFQWTGTDWKNVGHLWKESTLQVRAVRSARHGKHLPAKMKAKTVADLDELMDGSVRGLAFAGSQWYAATSQGLYRSTDYEFAWRGGAVQGTTDFLNVSAKGRMVLANAGAQMYLSSDAGETWKALALPEGWKRARWVALDDYGQEWVGGRQGVAHSRDQGSTWEALRLPIVDISGLSYDPHLRRVLVTSYASTMIFGIDPTTMQWRWWNPGWRVHGAQAVKGGLIATTFLHGVVMQPAQPESARSESHGMGNLADSRE